jgi:hypothetical protein
MNQPDWTSADETLFKQSVAVIRQFITDHPDELFSTFAFSVDCLYTGAALNFDTLEHSLAEAQRHERYQIKHRSQLFADESSWRDARYFVAHYTRRVDDCNLRGSFKYDLVAFVEVPVWEDYFNSNEECAELDGRVIVALWRVVDRLVKVGAFNGLKMSPCFRIAFSFHDDEMIVLRILNWPHEERDTYQDVAADRPCD